MKTIIKQLSFFMALLSVCSIFLSAPSFAGDRPNILIMGEDADEDTVPRNSRVFKRVLNAVSNQLHDMGFDVYDETAITMDNFEQGRVRRSDQELIDIGRSVRRPPIDVVVMFSIYASVKDVGYTSKVKTRIEGRMLQVNSGKRLGNFEVKTPKNWTAPAKCNRECVLEVVGDYSKILSNDLGAVLGEKLAYMVDGSIGVADGSGNGGLTTDYNLIFDNFSSSDMMDIEEYLVIFSGYKTHRPTYNSARRSELWYQSTIKSAKLNRNLNKMIEQLNLKSRITFSGNTFTVENIALRGKPKKVSGDDW